MRICGRNTSTPPTPASTPSTSSARIHGRGGGKRRRNALGKDADALLHQIGERRARPAEGEGEHQRQHGKKMGKANTRWVSTRSILSEIVVSCSRWRGKPDSFNAFSMAA